MPPTPSSDYRSPAHKLFCVSLKLAAQRQVRVMRFVMQSKFGEMLFDEVPSGIIPKPMTKALFVVAKVEFGLDPVALNTERSGDYTQGDVSWRYTMTDRTIALIRQP